ncbi:MAG: hypothetical protein FH748_13800 [Balneolaceae bacterium]|nr:hypothetical protein [Balneolaceae bacterium]
MDREKIPVVYSERSMSLSIPRLILDLSAWWIFGIVLFLYLLVAGISQEFIYKNSLYYRSYSGTLTNDTIEGMLGFQSRFWWTGYAVTPIILLFKFLFTSICISIGAMLQGIDIKFKDIFKTAMLAEGVFIVAQVIFMISLYVHLEDVTLQNTSGYYPFSALYFIGMENVNAQWAVYPLQTINLFEVLYVAVIAWLLSKKWRPDFIEGLNIVIPSYGLGLLLWMVLVAFLILQVS